MPRPSELRCSSLHIHHKSSHQLIAGASKYMFDLFIIPLIERLTRHRLWGRIRSQRTISRPNFSIGPAPNGPIELGSVINNLQNIEVINDECRSDIPQAKIYCYHKRGFTTTRSKMHKGEYGAWA